MTERKDTGRIYLQNVDHANSHSSFKTELAPIRQSNLCCEIDLPTKPLNDINDPDGEIALCTLSAINWGSFRNPADMQKACALAVRGLDALLSYQHYPILAAQLATENRRPLGVGIINFAYWLAKHDVSYSNPDALELVDTWAQHWSYYLIKASADLAAEQGACPKNNETKYSDGVLPIDTYKREVDELVQHTDKVDWAGLREQLKATGIRNSTLMALMPAETSAQISNSTNGIEPPQKSPEGYLKITAILQKYIDQGISVNTSYNPQHYEDEKIPMSTMLQHLLLCYKYGHKQLYYFNTYDGSGEIDIDKMNEKHRFEDSVYIELPYEDEACDSCTI